MRAEEARPILIVDDDPITAEVLSGLLKNAGFKTLLAHDLKNAKGLVYEYPVGLILLDVHLPDGNGVEFCKKLKTIPFMEGVPILFISSDAETSVKVMGFDAGAVDYITKPISGPEVLARVRTHLRLRQAYEALKEEQERRIQTLSTSQNTMFPDPKASLEARCQLYVRQVLEAGGDFCDVVASGEGVFDYVVADVSGHDLGASLWTAAFKALFLEYASPLYAVREICQRLNSAMGRLLPESAYLTAIYARVNRITNRIFLVNAGHPPAIHVKSSTGQASILEQQGDILGKFADAFFHELEIPVRPGDRLFLYTDGLVELHGGRMHGIQELLEKCEDTFLEPLDIAVPKIVEKLVSTNPQDDILLLGIEV